MKRGGDNAATRRRDRAKARREATERRREEAAKRARDQVDFDRLAEARAEITSAAKARARGGPNTKLPSHRQWRKSVSVAPQYYLALNEIKEKTGGNRSNIVESLIHVLAEHYGVEIQSHDDAALIVGGSARPVTRMRRPVRRAGVQTL